VAGFFMCNLNEIRTTELQQKEMGDCTTPEAKPSITKSTVYETESKFVRWQIRQLPFSTFSDWAFCFQPVSFTFAAWKFRFKVSGL